ncbi:MAG: signal peptide peptidase SppA [Myxococcota bacterium]
MKPKESGGPRAGLVLGRLLRNVAGIARDAALAPFRRMAPRRWLAIRLDRGLPETSTAASWPAGRLQSPALPTVLDALARAIPDPDLQGVLLRVGTSALGWARIVALGRSVRALREAGKRVVVYAERTGNAGAWLGALADHFWVAPEGRIDLIGIRAQSPYFRRALDRFGIRAEVLQAGRYKSFGEIFTRDSMSPETREALEAVVDELYETLVEGLASGKAGSTEQARRWIDEGPYVAAEALEIGLVDDLVYGDEIPGRLAGIDDPQRERAEARLLGPRTYLHLLPRAVPWQPIWGVPDRIVVVPIVGLLGAGAGSPRGVVGVLRRLARDDRVAGVVVRIDSPGGDPLAADLIWRAVRKVAERKPIVASFGNTAASGGYYVATGANAIISEATTLTGSIGVVWAMPDLTGLLEEVGVRVDAVERGAHAGIYDPTRARTDEERSRLRKQVDQMYGDFVGRVASGRGIEQERVREMAEGRVWTGAQAAELGLVDELGGLDRAVARVRELAGLPPDGEAPEVARGTRVSIWRSLGPEPIAAVSGLQLVCTTQVPLR